MSSTLSTLPALHAATLQKLEPSHSAVAERFLVCDYDLQAGQLLCIHHLCQALRFLALRVKATRSLKGLAGIKFDAGTEPCIFKRRALAFRLLLSKNAAGSCSFCEPVVAAGLPMAGPEPASFATNFFVTSMMS